MEQRTESFGLLPQGKEKQALEAVLFACGEPIEAEALSQTLGIPLKRLEELLEELRAEYDSAVRGIRLLRLDGAYQLCTREEYAGCVRALLDKKREISLSPAALEVLAITAYNQPVTRAFLEQVRGVDSSGVVASLLDKGLLEERGRLDVPGRPMQFGTTALFLRCFGLTSLEDLPPMQEQAQPMLQLSLEEAENSEKG